MPSRHIDQMTVWALCHQSQSARVTDGRLSCDSQRNIDQRMTHSHIVVHGTDGSQHAHNLAFSSIYTEWLNDESIKCFKVHFCNRCVGSRTHHIDKAFEGFSCDDYLINCGTGLTSGSLIL